MERLSLMDIYFFSILDYSFQDCISVLQSSLPSSLYDKCQSLVLITTVEAAVAVIAFGLIAIVCFFWPWEDEP